VSDTRPYDNPATQADRREVLKDTFLSRAQADAELEAQGRFKKQTATRVTGVPVYPSQPPSSPWACDQVGVEPPLGFRVSESFSASFV
jgi:hypothetical protein